MSMTWSSRTRAIARGGNILTARALGSLVVVKKLIGRALESLHVVRNDEASTGVVARGGKMIRRALETLLVAEK